LDTDHSAVIEYPVFEKARKQVVFFPGLVSGTPRARLGEIENLRWVRQEALADYLFPDTVAACMELIEKIR